MHNLPNLKQIPKRSYISGVPIYANDFVLAQIINDNKTSNYLYITANEGNFLNKDEVLLKNNVRFKSNDFIIETEKVIFNRNEQTAQSNSKSLFKSEKTVITSDGFDIYEKGNKIIFYGNSLIVLKWKQ